MAKRKNRFLFHGKCKACAGAITDWRERVAIARSRLYAFELRDSLLVAYEWCTRCRPHAMELRAMRDAVSRLSAPKINAGTVTGRMSASVPNIQNWSPKKGSKVKIIVDPSR